MSSFTSLIQYHREASSLRTDNTSPESTPSMRSSHSYDDMYQLHGQNSFEMRPIHQKDEVRLKNDNDEGDGLLSGTRRESMQSAQSFELYTPDEDRTVLKKLDRKLVAFMALLYCLSFLDRSNIGNARIAGLSDDLNLTPAQYEWLLWAFYITYIAFEWMTLMYRIVPAHIYISICILSWGILASLQAIAPSFGVLVFLRAMLGVGEAAFGPGVPFYLSFFFRRHELAFRTGLFISASPLSSSFAGALAYVITKAGKHGPWRAWRLLFLLEGFPSVLVAVWAWDFIPDSPGTAKWLSSREKEVAVLRLRQEKETEQDDEEKYSQRHRLKGLNMGEVIQALKDPKCYLTALMFFSCNVAFSSMPVFLPTILLDMGYESITAQALSAPPYLFAFAVVLMTAYASDRLQSRSSFIMLHSLFATLGYGTIASCGYLGIDNNVIKYLALYPATAGFFSAITIIITWTINNQETATKKGSAMVMLNVIGQMGPLLGTSIFANDGPLYYRSLGLCAMFMFIVGVLAVVLRLVLVRRNANAVKIALNHTGTPSNEDGPFGSRPPVFMYML